MEGVFFRPWIGMQYETGGIFNKRVLVLGESHYQWDVDIQLSQTLTIDCIQEQIDGQATFAFWTKVVTAFLDHRPSLEDKRAFWHSVAFYNYIQANVGLGPRVRPTDEMWADAAAPFLSVIHALKPQCIIVLGYGLWERVPHVGHAGPKLEGVDRPDTWRYPVDEAGGEALAYGILHPSSGGFSGDYWRPFIMRVLALA